MHASGTSTRVLHLTWSTFGVGTYTTAAWERSAYWEAKRSGRAERPPVDLGGLEQFAPPGFKAFLERAKASGELLKEYAFEHVRRERFPERPSRWRCIYTLTPGTSEQHALEVLSRMGFVVGARPLVELELHDDRAFPACSRWLDCNGRAPSEMEDAAAAYWRGEGEPDELLYEGRFSVVRVVVSSV